MRRWLAGAAVALAVVAGVLLVRDATLSTHRTPAPESQLVVVVEAHTRGGERSQTLEEMTEAQVLACRLEVESDPIGPLEPLGENRFQFVLQPSLDHTDQRQFRGCLEDWAIDHFQLDVEAMTEL